MLNSRDYWIVRGTSAAATLQDLDHVVAAEQDVYLRYLYVEASDGSRVAWSLERPGGTTVLEGYSPFYADFGMEGLHVPGNAGDDLQLTVSAGAGGIVTKAYMMGIDKPRSH